MAMFRRSPKSTPPLQRKQEELARRESELRDRLERLERTIANVPRIGEDCPTPREERHIKTNPGGNRFHVSVALQDRRYFDESRGTRRHRSLRKQRREGRIVFLILVMALAAAVIWLMSHLHL